MSLFSAALGHCVSLRRVSVQPGGWHCLGLGSEQCLPFVLLSSFPLCSPSMFSTKYPSKHTVALACGTSRAVRLLYRYLQ